MSGIGVIVNPNASGNRGKESRVARLCAILGDDGEVIATQDFEELEICLERFKKRQVDILAVCGGDGSYYHAFTRAVRIWGTQALPSFLCLRGGTINNLSRTVRALGRPEKLLAKVVRTLREGGELKTERRGLIRVNRVDYGHIVGAGLITPFLELYYAGHRPGAPSAFGWLIVLFFSNLFGTELIGRVARTVPASVECDGEKLAFDAYTLIIASSIDHIGLGVRPFYLSGREQSRFHVVAGDPTPWQLLRKLWRFLFGFPPNLDSLHDDLAGRVVIEFDEPQPYTINGELCGPASRLVLDAGPQVSFIRG